MIIQNGQTSADASGGVGSYPTSGTNVSILKPGISISVLNSVQSRLWMLRSYVESLAILLPALQNYLLSRLSYFFVIKVVIYILSWNRLFSSTPCFDRASNSVLWFERNRASNKTALRTNTTWRISFISKRGFVRNTVKSYHCSSNKTVLRTNRTAVLRTLCFEHRAWRQSATILGEAMTEVSKGVHELVSTLTRDGQKVRVRECFIYLIIRVLQATTFEVM